MAWARQRRPMNMPGYLDFLDNEKLNIRKPVNALRMYIGIPTKYET